MTKPDETLARAIRDLRFYAERLCKDRPETYEVYQTAEGTETKLSDAVRVVLSALATAPASAPAATPLMDSLRECDEKAKDLPTWATDINAAHAAQYDRPAATAGEPEQCQGRNGCLGCDGECMDDAPPAPTPSATTCANCGKPKDEHVREGDDLYCYPMNKAMHSLSRVARTNMLAATFVPPASAPAATAGNTNSVSTGSSLGVPAPAATPEPELCADCGLEHGNAYPKEPTVQRREDGVVRCADCQRKHTQPKRPAATAGKCPKCGGPTEEWNQPGRVTPAIRCITNGCTWFIDARPAAPSGEEAETLAQRFHEAYERLAPSFGYTTREASAKPWAEVPESNRRLMIAVCAEVLTAQATELAALREENAELRTRRDDLYKFSLIEGEKFTAAKKELAALRARVEEQTALLERVLRFVNYEKGNQDSYNSIRAAVRAALAPPKP